MIDRLQQQASAGKGVSAGEALDLFVAGAATPFRVMTAASEIREHFKGKSVVFCGTSRATSGGCSEGCAFCAPPSRHRTESPDDFLREPGRIVDEARAAARGGAEWFGIPAGGRQIRGKREWTRLCKAIEGIREAGLSPCASLGPIDASQAASLKAAGLVRYHHNLAPARSGFPKICTTHDDREDLAAVRTAMAAGLGVCSGGLIGQGEGISHRIALAQTLRELAVDAIPLSIFTPVQGTPPGRALALPPLEILMTIAVFRFMLPDKDIALCGGGKTPLRQLLPLGLVAGANALMTGHDLTTTGRDSGLDREMVLDLNLLPTREARPLCTCEAASAAKPSAPSKKGGTRGL